MSVSQETQNLSYHFSLVLSQWHTMSFNKLLVFSIIVRVSHFAILRKYVLQSYLIVTRKCPKPALLTHIKPAFSPDSIYLEPFHPVSTHLFANTPITKDKRVLTFFIT